MNLPPVQSGIDFVICDLSLQDFWVNRMDRFIPTLDRYRNAGATFVGICPSSKEDFKSIAGTIAPLAEIRNIIKAHPERFQLAETAADIEEAKREGRLSIGFYLHDSAPIQQSLDMIDLYYDLGVRWMLLALNLQNYVGGGCTENPDSGLTAFGREVVQRMNRASMTVDLSHCGFRTSMEAMELSSAPCIFSHSNASSVYDHPRNINDDQIRALGESGGVIGIMGVGPFLNAEQDVHVSSMARHIDHVASLIGPEHVALALDMYDDCIDEFYAFYAPGADPPGGHIVGVAPPWTFLYPEQYGELAEYLLTSGYSDSDVRGIMGENFLRVARTAWQ